MQLYAINAGHFKMDGGACFGVVPKSLWQKWVPSDANNLINLTSRNILAATDNRLIVVDTGLGNKQDEKFFRHFHRFGEETLQNTIAKAGFSMSDVTDVILTHLHFDHCGGALEFDPNTGLPIPVFPNATYYVSKQQWDWAMNPNPREAASYFRENFYPLFESGRLEFVHQAGNFCQGVELHIKNGHTQGLIVPEFDYKGQKVVFVGDFISTMYNLPIPFVPSFDIQPLESMKEKAEFLEYALANGVVLFFQHDYYNECCTLTRTEKGIREKEVFTLENL